MPERFVILCVDDDPLNTQMLSRVLQEKYVVLIANSALEGLKLLERQKVQVIISDQRMPDMTGMEFLRQVRLQNEKIVFFMLTAFAELNMAMEALNMGKIQGYFQKPVRAADLLVFLKRECKRLQLEEDNDRLFEQGITLNEELKNLNKLKSDFLRFLSHEIRTPLATVKTCLELVKPTEVFGRLEDYSTIWNLAQSSNESLRRLLESVLFLLEIENLGFEVKREPISVKSHVREAVAFLKGELAGKALHFNDELLEETRIIGDPEGFSRVLKSLFSNAIEFSRPGGEIQVGSRSAGKNLKVWIVGHGEGVHPDFSEKVFYISAQDAHANGRGRIGAGINMAIARMLIKAYGGKIGLEKDSCGKTAIFIELPISPVAP